MFALFRDSHDYFNRLLRVDIIRWEKIERDASGDNKNDVRCLFIARETSRRRGVMHFWQGINLTTNRALFRSTLYSLGIIVSFIMVHLIKAHARLYGCVSRESYVSWPWNASKSQRKRNNFEKSYRKFSLMCIRGKFRWIALQCTHMCAAASVNEHSDILPFLVKLCARLRTMRIAMHACSFVTSRACVSYQKFTKPFRSTIAR